MSHRWPVAAILALSVACQKEKPAPDPGGPAQRAASSVEVGLLPPSVTPEHSPVLPDLSYRVVPLKVCQPEGLDPLGAARKYFHAGRYEDALSCAAQACAFEPEDPQAHADRGMALAALGRYEEAGLALSRALALDPNHLDALLAAARLYAVQMPTLRERDELGSVYAEHGLMVAEEQGDKPMQVELSLISAIAFNDLGQARDALDRADLVLGLERRNKDALYERAIALFELCRFAEAKAAFTAMLEDPDRSAHAHQHVALLLEREGKHPQAERHFAKAREQAPGEFPEPVQVGVEEFRAAVSRAVAELPEDMRKDLTGVPVGAEEIPKDADLLSGETPLSPAILGLFRGPSLGEKCSPDEKPCRSMALYRRNLARAVRNAEELREQIRITLLHEVGHLRGEDDTELAARGLE